MRNLKILVYALIPLFVINQAKSCPECEINGASPASFSLIPSKSLYAINLASAGSEAVALVAMEDEEDITTLSNTNSLTLKESRGLSRINKRNLYKKSIKGKTGLKIGDWVDLPARKVEVAPLKENIVNAEGYILKVYTHLEQGKFENNHLAFEIEVIGGYKRNLNDVTFIAESNVRNGDIYLVEAKKIATNGTIKGRNKVYRYFEKAAKPIDNWWYYEKNGVKTKAEKIIQKQRDDSFLATQRIYHKNSIDVTSEIKIKESVKDSERVVKNGRIFRGKHAAQVAGKYANKTASTSKTILDANGDVFKETTESNTYYLNGVADHKNGRLRTKANKDGTITLFEYHPTLEGNFRAYTTEKGVELKDISGDGTIGVEDLQNTQVIVEDKECIDWQGSRHSKRLINKKAKASFSTTTNSNGYNVVLSDEKILSKKAYEHKRTENGGVIEEISTYTANPNGELHKTNVFAAEYETLALSEPIAQYNLSNLSDETQVGKTIYVPDGGSVGFSASGFLNGIVPNYANAPRFDSTANTYYCNFTLIGIRSETSSTISLPWGGTYTANSFALVSGKSTLEVELVLDYSGTTLYEATYVYVDGAFHLGEWTYYNRDMSDYELRGTYKHNNTYSTQSALDENNIRNFTDFDGHQYQIGYSDSTATKEIFRRDIGVASTEYGDQKDTITVYTKDLSDGSCGTCGDAPSEFGEKAVSYFASSQIGGYGGVNPGGGDTLLYQTYEFSLSEDVKTLEVDKYGVVIRREYTDNNDGTYTLKEIRPGFTSENPYSILVANKEDNSTISLTGAGIVNEYHTKLSESVSRVVYGYPESGRYVESEVDENGNKIRETTPLGTTTYMYDGAGLITNTIYPNGVIETSRYDAFGNLISKTKKEEGYSISATESNSIHYEVTDGVLWRVIQEDNSESSYLYKIRLNSFGVLSEDGHPVSEYSEIIWDGQKKISLRYIDRDSKKQVFTEKYYDTTGPLQTLNQEIKYTAYNGKTVEILETTSSNLLLTKFTYNDQQELTGETYYIDEAQSLSVIYCYEDSSLISIMDGYEDGKGLKSLGRLYAKTYFNGSEKFGEMVQYISRDEKNAGNLKAKIVPTTFGSNNKPISGRTTYYDYNDMGMISKIWGADEIPSIFHYNEFGELIDMYLFKDIPNNASLFASATWPSSYGITHPSVEHISWNIVSNTGMLTSKTDARNKVTNGIYSASGDLLTLTDPNGNVINYTYALNGKVVTEQLLNDSDTLVSYAYNEDGSLASVQSTLGNIALTYNTNNRNMPETETMQDGYELCRTFDANGNVVNVVLKDVQENEVYSVNYSYNSSGFASINASGRIITYNYNPNGTISELNLNNISRIRYTYDDLHRIKAITYLHGNNEVRKNTYNYRADGNIESVYIRKNNEDYANWEYEYFSSQQGLKKATLYKGSIQTTLFDIYSQEEFEYDLAGNPYRIRCNSMNNWTSYTSNIANHTTQIDYSTNLVFPIRGETTLNTVLNVKLDGDIFADVSRDGKGFLVSIPSYSLQRKYNEISIESVLSGAGVNNADAKAIQIGSLYIPQTPEVLSYDDNGNLISDSRWDYTWDYKNQLISAETSNAAVAVGVPRVKYIYTYDYKGRKVKSEYYKYDNSVWGLVSTNRRFYDNWNLIYETTEYADTSIVTDVKKYYYGMDLFATIYFSGGMGSLCMVDFNNEVGFVFSGANTNVESIFSADANCAVLADYLYSSYGDTILQSGEFAQINPMRFSTRYKEDTSLYYYGYRHYSPKLRKWISNEPLGESESRNLYSFVLNNPINNIDILGKFRHGNWGGGNWTGGQEKSWQDLTPSERERLEKEKDPNKGGPIDGEDRCYKYHDICYGKCAMDECNKMDKDKMYNCRSKCDNALADCLLAYLGRPNRNKSRDQGNILRARLFKNNLGAKHYYGK